MLPGSWALRDRACLSLEQAWQGCAWPASSTNGAGAAFKRAPVRGPIAGLTRSPVHPELCEPRQAPSLLQALVSPSLALQGLQRKLG